jgi:hypothetical protein
MKRLLTFFQQAWIREDGDEEARSTMLECLNLIHKNNQDNYIEFIRHYGPALAGIRTWNQNKALKPVSELLTNSDEAFIHLCIINYGDTWKAQDKIKTGETGIVVPVSDHSSFHV